MNLVDSRVTIKERLKIIGGSRSRTKKSNMKDGNGDISVTKNRHTSRLKRYAFPCMQCYIFGLHLC